MYSELYTKLYLPALLKILRCGPPKSQKSIKSDYKNNIIINCVYALNGNKNAEL